MIRLLLLMLIFVSCSKPPCDCEENTKAWRNGRLMYEKTRKIDGCATPGVTTFRNVEPNGAQVTSIKQIKCR